MNTTTYQTKPLLCPNKYHHEYKFERIGNSNIVIMIKAKQLEHAYELLVETTKHPADFILKT